MKFPAEKFKNITSQSSSILIISRSNPNEEEILAMAALSEFFQSKKKKVRVVGPKKVPEKFSFLAVNKDSFSENLKNDRRIEIKLPLEESQIKTLSHKNNAGEGISITIESKNLPIIPEDIKFSDSKVPHFDLIISINVSDLSEIGAPFLAHPKIFQSCPIISFGAGMLHNNFASENFYNPKAGTACENIFEVLEPQIKTQKIFLRCFYPE